MNSNIDFFCRQTPKYITYLANQTHYSKKITETYKPASADQCVQPVYCNQYIFQPDKYYHGKLCYSVKTLEKTSIFYERFCLFILLAFLNYSGDFGSKMGLVNSLLLFSFFLKNFRYTTKKATKTKIKKTVNKMTGQ